jgi:hypothetical protein
MRLPTRDTTTTRVREEMTMLWAKASAGEREEDATITMDKNS